MVKQIAGRVAEGRDPVAEGLISGESFLLIKSSDAFQGLVREIKENGSDRLEREV